MLDHLGEGFRVEPRKFVDMLARVLAVRDAKPEVEVEGLEVLVAKKVALDHPKILRTENHIVMHLILDFLCREICRCKIVFLTKCFRVILNFTQFFLKHKYFASFFNSGNQILYINHKNYILDDVEKLAFTGFDPTVNSTVAPTVRSFRNSIKKMLIIGELFRVRTFFYKNDLLVM